MNKVSGKLSLLILMASFLAPGILVAQEEEKEKGTREKKEAEQIIITRKGDKNEKVVIEINGDKITVNGKPASDLKDGDISVRRSKIRDIRAYADGFRGQTGVFPGGDHYTIFAMDSNRAMLGVMTEKTEDSYNETGGGSALDLHVAKRKSDEMAVNGLLAAGFEWGAMRPDEGYFRMELEAGRRQIVGGSLGDTEASFEDGESFILEPEERESGWVGRLRAIGGGAGFRIAGEVGAEEREDKVGLSARASLVLGL